MGSWLERNSESATKKLLSLVPLMSNVRRIRPLTIQQLREAADNGTLTPEDIQACSWIKYARKIYVPHSAAEKLAAELVAYVRAWRENRRMTAKDFAATLQMSSSYLTQLECGHIKTPTLAVLMRLATAVGGELRCDFVPRPRSRRVKAS
jgi:ribosome-binding protein aMBF1 (putative translation factor)